MPISNPHELRLAARSGQLTGHTSGHCHGYVQGNVVILPEDWAGEFLRFCQLNPKPCPLIAVSDAGQYSLPSLGAELDIRTDVLCYRVFARGQLVEEPDFGHSVTVQADELPLFWACGVTPQVALEQARPPLCITHSPGSMLVTDLLNSQLAIM